MKASDLDRVEELLRKLAATDEEAAKLFQQLKALD